MVAPGHANRDRQLGVIVFNHHLAGSKQVKLKAAPQTGLVDIRQKCVHLGLAGQLFLKLRDVLLDLLALLFQGLQIDRFGQFDFVLVAQLDFFGLLGNQLFFGSAEPHKPQYHHANCRNRDKQRIPG